MDSTNNFILECIKRDIERKTGRGMVTAGDFKILSLQIESVCTEPISAHTLMRVWGYLRTTGRPAPHTLDLLSRFLGYNGFEEYQRELNMRKSEGSAFIEGDVMIADMLGKGDEIMLKWHPGREVRIEYLGESLFRVVENRNSRLKAGEEFQCLTFAKGQPFTALITKSNHNAGLTYIGAREEGLMEIHLKSSR